MLCSLAQAAPEGSSSAWPLKKVNISFSKTRPYSPPLPYAWPSCSRKSPLPCMRMLFTYRNEGRVWCCLQGSCVFPALCPTGVTEHAPTQQAAKLGTQRTPEISAGRGVNSDSCPPSCFATNPPFPLICSSREQGRNILYPHEFYPLASYSCTSHRRAQNLPLGVSSSSPNPHIWITPHPT